MNRVIIGKLLILIGISITSLAQTPVSPIVQPHVNFVDNSGSPCAGCSVYSYAAGTSTPQATYTDSTGTSQNTNPIILDAAGGANIWLSSASYKFILKSTLGTTIWTVDNVQGYISACSLSGCTFTGPISGTTASFPGGFTGPIGQTSPAAGTFTTLTGQTINNIPYPTTFAALQADVTACGSSLCAIGINNSIPVTSNYTIPSNVTLIIASGSQLQPGTGITLTMSGTIKAANVQIFGGSGSIAGLTYDTPEWFGGTNVNIAYNALSATGGTISLQAKTYTAGGITITKPGVRLIGSGMPSYASGYTSLTGGTIIQGAVMAQQGANYIVIRDLGVDAGPALGTASDVIAIFNNGQVVGAPQVQNPIIENVSCLGFSPTTAAHCLLVENVNNASIKNVLAVNNTHGVVLKGTNSTIDGVWSAGHATDSVDIKSDTYAPGNNNVIKNVKISYLSTPGDTGPFFINSETVGGTGVPIYNISVSHVQTESVGSSANPTAFQITGQDPTYPATDINISDVTIDWPGGSTSGYACIFIVQSTARVNLSNINCKNYYYAIYTAFPNLTAMNDFTLTGSQFANITGGSAIQTDGRWNIAGNAFNNITGNAILAQNGNVNLGLNACTSCGAYFNKTSGSFTFDYRAYIGNSGAPTLSPTTVGAIQNMTAGQLVVNFLPNQFNAAPICEARPVSSAVPGTTTVPNIWINADTASGATFNASDATFAGQIHWTCTGSMQ